MSDNGERTFLTRGEAWILTYLGTMPTPSLDVMAILSAPFVTAESLTDALPVIEPATFPGYPSVRAALDGLTEKGLLSRAPKRAGDGGEPVSLTIKGRDIYGALVARAVSRMLFDHRLDARPADRELSERAASTDPIAP